jgi:asparagine synthase (glutamine-hydrolysing)
MSGISGVWNLDGAPVDADVLSRMDSALAHRAPGGGGMRIEGAVGFAHRGVAVTTEEIGERQPLAGANGVMLAWDGRLDNRSELLRPLGLPSTASDAACVLAAYGRWGEEFAPRLNGDFALALHDPAMRRLVLVRDAIGIRPLYYFHGNGIFGFGSEIKAVLAHPRVPVKADDEGLADFLMIGSRPVDRQDITCFARVSAVVPAHLVVVTPERLVARRYWDFDTGRSMRLTSFEEYAEAFGDVFRAAVARRTRSAFPVAVSVSGGLDSSSIFCQAERLRRDGAGACPSTIGISYLGALGSDADERRYLTYIERDFGVTIDRFAMAEHASVLAGVEQQLLAIEAPFLDYQWGLTCELDRRAGAANARVLLSGHWGDQVLFSAAYLVDLFGRLAWGEVWRHTREYRRWFGAEEAATLVRHLPYDVVRHHVPNRLAPPLKWLRARLTASERSREWFSDSFLAKGLRFANRPALIGRGFHSAHARSIYLEARSKYHVQCMEWNNKIAALHGLDAAFPFLDRDLLACLMAIPGEVQNRNGVPRAILREAMRGVLPEEVRARTWKADFTSTVNEGVALELPRIVGALTPSCLAVKLGYVDGRRLGPAVERLSAKLALPEASSSWDLVDLFGLESWLGVFLNHARDGEATETSS